MKTWQVKNTVRKEDVEWQGSQESWRPKNIGQNMQQNEIQELQKRSKDQIENMAEGRQSHGWAVGRMGLFPLFSVERLESHLLGRSNW